MKKKTLELTRERDKVQEEMKELDDVRRERDALNNRVEELSKKSTLLAEQIRTLNGQLGQAQGQTDSPDQKQAQ